MTGYEQPEWKSKAFGKAPVYGIPNSKTIKEQRQSLPIYQLKNELVRAVDQLEKKVLVVIGETGSGKTT